MTQKKFSDEEVKVMLHALEKHFGEPVKPVSQYCNALRTWAHAIVRLNSHPDHKRRGHGAEYAGVLNSLLIDISKSNFLWRLIYEGEKLRTVECPEHKGRLHLGFSQKPCTHGCDLTGWLPAKDETDG